MEYRIKDPDSIAAIRRRIMPTAQAVPINSAIPSVPAPTQNIDIPAMPDPMYQNPDIEKPEAIPTWKRMLGGALSGMGRAAAASTNAPSGYQAFGSAFGAGLGNVGEMLQQERAKQAEQEEAQKAIQRKLFEAEQEQRIKYPYEARLLQMKESAASLKDEARAKRIQQSRESLMKLKSEDPDIFEKAATIAAQDPAVKYGMLSGEELSAKIENIFTAMRLARQAPKPAARPVAIEQPTIAKPVVTEKPQGSLWRKFVK